MGLLAIAVGLVVTTVTLSVTADSGTWAEATAAAGIVATVVGAGVMLGTTQGWTNGAKVSLAALSTGVFGIGAIALAIVAYAGSTGDGGSITNVTPEGAALTQQETNNQVQPPGYAHDLGQQPTALEFLSADNATVLSRVPGGTVSPDEVDVLRGEIGEAREFALAHNTPEKAMAAGFYNTTNDVPFMGAHFLNREYLLDGIFDPSKPEGLLFSKLGNPGGEWQLVGVWYLILPGQGGGASVDAPPAGFTGNLDLWHAHHGLCTRAGVISENNTAEGCAADSGNFIGDLRWMMHVWVYPESGADNSDGVFVYLNADLFEQQRVQAGP